MTHPFTYQELFQGLRRFFPVDDAHELATQAATPPVSPARRGQSETSPRPQAAIDFSLDVLIVMSLMSDETREKVEQWRRRAGRDPSPGEQAEWNRRRAELMEWAREGYIRQPDGRS